MLIGCSASFEGLLLTPFDVQALFIGVNRLFCVLPGPLTNAIRRPPRLVLPQALRAVRGKTRALPTSIAPESGVHAVSTVRGIGRSLRRNRVTVIFARMSRRVIMGTTYALTRTLTAQALYVHSVTHIQPHSQSVTHISVIHIHCVISFHLTCDNSF